MISGHSLRLELIYELWTGCRSRRTLRQEVMSMDVPMDGREARCRHILLLSVQVLLNHRVLLAPWQNLPVRMINQLKLVSTSRE